MPTNPTPFALLHQLQRDRRPFERVEVRKLPLDRHGVYAIWEPPEYAGSDAKCAYVGMSITCVRRRLLDHINNETNPALRNHLRDFRDHVTFTVVFTDGDPETRDLERHAIDSLEPVCNRL